MAQEHKGRKNTPAKQSSARTGRPQRKPSYQDRRQFPESASTYRQAKLLLLGCMPALRQTLLELWCTLRSKLSALTIRRRLETMTPPKLAHTALFLAASLAIAVFAVYQVLYTTATTVVFDGVELATVASEAEAEAAKHSVEPL